jgi:trigger factor
MWGFKSLRAHHVHAQAVRATAEQGHRAVPTNRIQDIGHVSIKTVETENEGLKRAFMLTIPAEDIEKRVDQEVKRIAPQVRMPGFRPGKVPPNLIRKMHGDALRGDALQGAVQDGVQQLLSEQNIRPALQPQVELDQTYEPGKDAEVRVRLEALPDLPAPQIDNLKLERLTVDADEAAIEQQLTQLASANKRWDDAPKTHAAAAGDLVVMDFEGEVEGKPFEGGKGEDMQVELGSGRLIPGFEEQLVGAKAGDTREVNVSFPEDYPVGDLAGKAASFAVTVKGVKTAGDTALDDEFAKTLGLQSLDQLKNLVRDQQTQELSQLTRTHMKRQLLDELAGRHDFPVPQSMVDAEHQNILAQLRHEASHDDNPQAALAEIESEAEDYRRIAERRVRLGLLLSEIGAANGVEITQQEMNRLIGQTAAQYQGEERERFLKLVQSEPMFAAQIRAPLYEDKVVDFLFSTAEITDRQATREQLEADLESEDGHVHGPGCGHDHSHDEKPAKAKAKAKQATAEAAPSDEPGLKGAGSKVGTKPAKSAKGKPAPDKVNLNEEKSDAAKPAKPLKSEPANKAAAKAADTGDAAPKKAAGKKPAKKA